ncbi:MAG: ABC transporter ATP-binding protein [Actinomycetota bacterium]|nr:ABC transporter ATP-binding protein [Actinomycetota bacterium]
MNSVINIANVKKSLGNREILKGISFTVEKGDIFGYLGPNGAGKTTTIRILLGLFRADSGKMDILGQDIGLSQIRRKIGFVLDLDGLYENMTAEQNMIFYSQIYGLSNTGERIHKILRMMNLEDRSGDKVGTYSRGMRQRLALARSLVHDPEVLILDEPTAGVDPSGQIEIRQIMLDIVRKENKTIFLSSHNLDEVQRICNRIALIDRGEIKLYGELENLRRKMGKGAVIIETMHDIPESLMTELKNLSHFGLKEKKERTLVFSPMDGTEISDIISFLASRGVKIEEALKKEASLEEMYEAILKEVEPS